MDVLVELLKLTVATKLAESTMKVVRHGAALLELLDDNFTHGYIAVLWVWEESQLMQMMADRVWYFTCTMRTRSARENYLLWLGYAACNSKSK